MRHGANLQEAPGQTHSSQADLATPFTRIGGFLLRRRTRWELPLAIAVVAILTGLFASQSYFFADDLFFPAYFREHPPDISMLRRSWFGHLMPAYILSIVGFLKVFWLSWPAAAAFIALISTGAFTALVRIVDAVVGSRRIALLAGLAFTFSLGPIALRLWWAASLNNVVALAISLAALGCFTRFVEHRKWTSLAAGFVLYGLALASSEKSLLFSMHIFLWCVLVIWRGQPIVARVKNALRTWPVWVGIIVLSLAEIALYLRGPYLQESGASPSLRTTVAFMGHSIFGGLVPSFFGFDLLDDPLNPFSPAIVAAAVLLAVVVVWTTVIRRSNGGVWIFMTIVVLANTYVLSKRADIIGIGAGRELRYHLENSALIWAGLGVIAFSTLMQLRSNRRRRSAPSTRRRIGATAIAVVTVGVLAISASAWSVSFSRIVDSNVGPGARAWVDTMQATVTDDTPFIDTPLPDPVALKSLWPYNMTSAILPLYGHDVQYTNSLEGAWVVGGDGRAGPAVFLPDSEITFDSRCVNSFTTVSASDVSSGPERYVAVTYTQSTGGTLDLNLGGQMNSISVPSGSGTVVAYFPYGTQAETLTLSTNSLDLCVASMWVGSVDPGR